MIVIVDYGRGNLLSVKNAIEYLGADVVVSDSPETLAEAERVIIPGVGAFGDCMARLRGRGFISPLNEVVLGKRLPVLGICLGMQIMAKVGYEGGKHDGLGWFDAEVVKIPANKDLRIPHMGWDNIHLKRECNLFDNTLVNHDYYFVHSYYMKCQRKRD